MSTPIDYDVSRFIRHHLKSDGSFSSESETLSHKSAATVTWHEISAHLQNHGAYELALAADNLLGRREGLLALGIKVNAPDPEGQTPLLHALELGRARDVGFYLVSAGVGWLLESGADPDAANSNGQTPLQLAAALNFLPIVHDLRQAGAVCAGERTLEVAPCKEPEKSRDAVQVFLSLGGDLEAPPGDLMPALADDELMFFHKRGTFGKATRDGSYTSFLVAASAGDVPLMEALRAAGANISAFLRNDCGAGSESGDLGAVALAARRFHLDAVRQLLEWGVPLRPARKYTSGPLDCCLETYESHMRQEKGTGKGLYNRMVRWENVCVYSSTTATGPVEAPLLPRAVT